MEWANYISRYEHNVMLRQDLSSSNRNEAEPFIANSDVHFVKMGTTPLQ